MKLPCEVRDLHQLCPELVSFKHKMKDYVPKDWRWDVVKFSNKVFATVHGLSDWTGTGIWLDADNVVHREMPVSFLDGLIPQGQYCGHFFRDTSHAPYTETGFLMFRCGHPSHAKFMKLWKEQFTEGGVFKSKIGWHDCTAFDQARLGIPGFVSLSGEHHKAMHPIAMSPIGGYLDHCKGNRKVKGHSGENPTHWWDQLTLKRPSVLGDAE